MKKNKIILSIVLATVMIATLFTGCVEADRVNYNIKQDADNFNITRRITVINSRSDKILLELIGNSSIQVDQAENQLEITSQIDENTYKIDYVNLNEWTTYTVEDLTGANVSKYHYEINYLPEAVQPFEIVSKE